MTTLFQRRIEADPVGLRRADTGGRPPAGDGGPIARYRTIGCETRVAFAATRGSARGARLGEIGRTQASGIVAELNPSGLLSLDQMRRTLDILSREVIPTFR